MSKSNVTVSLSITFVITFIVSVVVSVVSLSPSVLSGMFGGVIHQLLARFVERSGAVVYLWAEFILQVHHQFSMTVLVGIAHKQHSQHLLLTCVDGLFSLFWGRVLTLNTKGLGDALFH